MGFYGIITGKLWVFTGSGKTRFLGNYGFLWEDYGFFMGKLWVFIQTLLFSVKIRQKSKKIDLKWLGSSRIVSDS